MLARMQRLTDMQKLWLLIALATATRIIFAQTGLGIDEIYTVATSRQFVWSTYDHPPMAWWLSGAMQGLFHNHDAFVVRLPFIALSGVATWQVFALTRRLYGNQAGLFAALAFACAPELGITSGTWVLPDGPLLVAELACVQCLVPILLEDQSTIWRWLAAGFWGGLALLSKYHGIFLFLGAGLFILTTPGQRRQLAQPAIYLGALTGLILFSPVLIWNYEHHFASLSFQGGRLGVFRLHYLKPVLTVLGQALYLTPWIWLGLVLASIAALRAPRLDLRAYLLFCLGLPQILLFTLGSIGASAPVLFHWAMPGYLLLFPLLGDYLARLHKAHPVLIARAALATALFSLFLVGAVMSLWYWPQLLTAIAVRKDPLTDMRSFKGLQNYISAQSGDATNLTIAPTSWHLTGQIDYALAGRMPVTCLCADAREYGILAPLRARMGNDFMVVTEARNGAAYAALLPKLFAKVAPLPPLTLDLGNGHSAHFAVFDARNLQHLP
ncbi:MAG: glycosyltransferase family 39 protein [Hyphomicrobiales bacterium]|nr:glycosyltransferase family 39 protein [Hyphomicrobiales bacterium]MDE2114950.1 glycosyltransferase family 39 protein [Hyphomicrobiales bacterium]